MNQGIDKKVKVLLWDIDGTLLDFYAAQRAAIRTLFKKYELGECSDGMLADYSEINHKYWHRLELGEMTKPQILVGRFMEFFSKYGLNTSVVEAFNDDYQVALGDTICFYPHAMETLKACKEAGILQYAVTNGTKIAQDKKLRLSGLNEILDKVYISEVVGYEKPSPAFFEPILEEIRSHYPQITMEEIMIVGDSLTSDMKGGTNMGFKTCWYRLADMAHVEKPDELDYCIEDLAEVLPIINGARK